MVVPRAPNPTLHRRAKRVRCKRLLGCSSLPGAGPRENPLSLAFPSAFTRFLEPRRLTRRRRRCRFPLDLLEFPETCLRGTGRSALVRRAVRPARAEQLSWHSSNSRLVWEVQPNPTLHRRA